MNIGEGETFLTNTNNPMIQCKFIDNWPSELRFIASRKWGDILINGTATEVQTTFLFSPSDPVDPAIACGVLSTYDPSDFRKWLSAFCCRFVKEEVTKDWFENSPVNWVLRNRYEMTFQAALTFPLSSDAVAPALHVTFVVGSHKNDA